MLDSWPSELQKRNSLSCLTILGIYISGYNAEKTKDRFEDCCIEYVVGEVKENDVDSAYLKMI